MMTYETKSELITRLPVNTKVVLISDGSFGQVLRDLINANDKAVSGERLVGEGYAPSSGARMAVHDFCREFGWTLEAISKHPVPCYSLVRN